MGVGAGCGGEYVAAVAFLPIFSRSIQRINCCTPAHRTPTAPPPGAWAEVEVNTLPRPGWGGAAPNRTLLFLSHLETDSGMGCARLDCTSGCACRPGLLNTTSDGHASLFWLAPLEVGQRRSSCLPERSQCNACIGELRCTVVTLLSHLPYALPCSPPLLPPPHTHAGLCTPPLPSAGDDPRGRRGGAACAGGGCAGAAASGSSSCSSRSSSSGTSSSSRGSRSSSNCSNSSGGTSSSSRGSSGRSRPGPRAGAAGSCWGGAAAQGHAECGDGRPPVLPVLHCGAAGRHQQHCTTAAASAGNEASLTEHVIPLM